MFIALAPADNSCSQGGTLGCGFVKLNDANHQGRVGKSMFLDIDVDCRGLRIFRAKTLAMTSPARTRASPSNTMKRHGVSLPVIGHPRADVKMVSRSAGEGPGSLISRGFTERRISAVQWRRAPQILSWEISIMEPGR